MSVENLHDTESMMTFAPPNEERSEFRDFEAEHFRTNEVIGRLELQGLADYHFAVTALQLDGREVFLSNYLREDAEKLVATVHHELLVSASDALTREFSNFRTATYRTGKPSEDEGLRSVLAENPMLTEPFIGLVTEEEKQAIAESTRTYAEYGAQATHALYGMRRVLVTERDNKDAVQALAEDVSKLSEAMFIADNNTDGTTVDKQKNQDNWQMVAHLTGELSRAMQQGDQNKQIIFSNLLINAMHGNGPILERMFCAPGMTRETRQQINQTRKEIAGMLDATKGTYEDLLPYTSMAFGHMVYPYLTGRQKSLEGIRTSGKSVPKVFTSHEG